jgi:hypothetical protein
MSPPLAGGRPHTPRGLYSDAPACDWDRLESRSRPLMPMSVLALLVRCHRHRGALRAIATERTRRIRPGRTDHRRGTRRRHRPRRSQITPPKPICPHGQACSLLTFRPQRFMPLPEAGVRTLHLPKITNQYEDQRVPLRRFGYDEKSLGFALSEDLHSSGSHDGIIVTYGTWLTTLTAQH